MADNADMLLNALGRLLALVLWVPLLVCRPIIRHCDRRRRRAARRRALAAQAARKVPLGIPKRRPVDADDDDSTLRPPRAGLLGRRARRPAKVADGAPARTADPVPAMRAELARALNEDPGHRRTYKYLARFERKFGEAGLLSLEQIPVSDLRRALRDFEGLVRNWSSAPLADLRSRMAVVLADRSSAASMWVQANSVQSAFRSPGA